jgi:DNA-binding HxlR family transcriptional regulator
MSVKMILSEELLKLIQSRLEQTLKGIEDTLNRLLEDHQVTPQELEENLKRLEQSFTILFQKWSLEILYTLFLNNATGFGELKKVLSVNSRTLSDKLKLLKKQGYIDRKVNSGPPLRVEYTLTPKGKNSVLLALPLLYYSSAS